MAKAYSYIRFSSKKQIESDSFRRQTELSKKYCQDHGIELDINLNLYDLGLSAFHGRHISKGALGGFLQLVEDGKIERDSILLIENIDRLSRLNPMEALRIFDKIVHAGIKIVTLQSGMEYTEESINENQGQLYVIVGEIQRANQESKRKSFLVGNAWKKKRENAVNRKIIMTSKCPYWLSVSEDKKHFLPNEHAIQTIERIFQMKLEGIGSNRIEKILNEDPIAWKPPKSKRNKTGGWNKSYINKILYNEEVLGRYQPYEVVDKKRTKVGDPIEGYYPKIISDDLFFAVHNMLEEKNKISGNTGGRTGKMNNVFTNLVKCGFCGYPMHFIDKGKSPKGGQYLHCSYSRSRKKLLNGEVCNAKPIRYDELEKLIFDNLEELNINNLLPDEENNEKHLKSLNILLGSIEGKIKENTKRMRNLSLEISDEDNDVVRRMLKDQLNKFGKEDEKLLKEKIDLNKRIKNATNQKKQLIENIDQAKEIYQLLNSTKNEQESINLRLKLHNEIFKLIEWIKVYPIQPKHERISRLTKMYNELKQKGNLNLAEKGRLNVLKQSITREDEESDYYVAPLWDSKFLDKVRVKFRTGNLRLLCLRYHEE